VVAAAGGLSCKCLNAVASEGGTPIAIFWQAPRRTGLRQENDMTADLYVLLQSATFAAAVMCLVTEAMRRPVRVAG
jgi:hypothetical protein